MAGSSVGEGGIYNTVNLIVYHYGGNDPIKYVDPDGMFLEVNDNGDGTYTVSGGEANSDKNIYIMKDGKRSGDILGQMLTEYSFLDDEGNVTKSIENDWGFWEFLHTDQYYVETSDGIRYRANSEETVTLYGFNKIDLDFLNGKFNEMIDEANKKPTNFSRIWKESVGGDLDFKNQMDKSTLYFDGEVLYNNHEAGNFVWAYFLTSHGYRDLAGILAQGGSLVFEGRLDEPWDVQARHAGQYYYDKLMLLEMINKISR